MGFKRDFKTGLRELFNSIKTRIPKNRKSKKLTPIEIAHDVDRASIGIAARLVEVASSVSVSSPATPNKLITIQRPTTSSSGISRLPASLIWATKKSTPLPPVLITNGAIDESDSPQTISTQSTGPIGEGRPRRASSMTEVDPEKFNKH